MMQRDFIPIAGPWISQKEIDYVTDAVTNGWYENWDMWQRRFEKTLADYLGVRYAAALPSCTSGIHLALAAWGIEPGDEVIVPDVTWIGSSAPIDYVGATAVFADIDPETHCLCPESFRARITQRTRAVIPVDLYGHVYDADRIRTIAAEHGIRILEDAAESIGSEYHGKKAGALGNAGVFSFHGTKTLTTGEGGMLVTDDANLYERVVFLRDHGRDPWDKTFRNREVAFKYRMSGLQAALGTAQLERVHELVARKREIFSWYREELKDVEGIRLNAEVKGTRNSYWMVTMTWDERWGLKKEELIHQLAGKRITTRAFFYPLSSLEAYQNRPEAETARRLNKNSYAISPCGINLPSALKLTCEDVRYVCQTLKEIFPAYARTVR